MKKTIIPLTMLIATLTAHAQGGNVGMGGEDGDYQSLAERLAKVEKKHDMLDIYINYAAGAQAAEDGGTWRTRFANRELRLELKGNLTDKLYYRLRHRLNRNNKAAGLDNFAKATDLMLVGYDFSDKVTLMAGKVTQIWGGYEYDENPMFVYKYSDMLDHMKIFQAGAVLSVKPVPTQELAVMVSDVNNGTLSEEYGENLVIVDEDGLKPAVEANNPLTFIANWNGSFFDNKLQTRWAWGTQKEARGRSSRMITLGQKLNLPRLQWYADYMGEFDDLDRLGIVTEDMPGLVDGNFRCSKVRYNTFITKLNWQFAPQWNLMLKGTYETVDVKSVEALRDYRKSYGWIGSLEYYPDKTQDLRVFLAYMGNRVEYSKASNLENKNTNRVELGFMYRIKCY